MLTRRRLLTSAAALLAVGVAAPAASTAAEIRPITLYGFDRATGEERSVVTIMRLRERVGEMKVWEIVDVQEADANHFIFNPGEIYEIPAA